MIVGGLVLGSAAVGQVSANTKDVSFSGISGTVYAGVQFNTNGTEWSNAGANSTSFTVSRGSWLNSGASSGVWVERTISGDALNWQDPGTGRQQLSTTREFGLSRSTDGESTATVTFDFYDAASGGNLLDSVDIVLTAIRGTL